jgi:hypothetical protein
VDVRDGEAGLLLLSVTVAVVATRAGGVPAVVSCADNAIEKQPACAAAISSSGFVPAPFSNRVLNEYCALFSSPLSVEITPFPSLRLPFHSAEALRFIRQTTFCLNWPRSYCFTTTNDRMSDRYRRSMFSGAPSRLSSATTSNNRPLLSPGTPINNSMTRWRRTPV